MKNFMTMAMDGFVLPLFAGAEYPELPRKITAETAVAKDARMAWWTDVRFGMFIRFGLHSAAARHEWVKSYEQIPDAEYGAKYFSCFNPDLFDAREWGRTAKAAGTTAVLSLLWLSTWNLSGVSGAVDVSDLLNLVTYTGDLRVVKTEDLGGGVSRKWYAKASDADIRFEGGKVVVTPNRGGASGFARVRIPED